jgi:mannosyltransferase
MIKGTDQRKTILELMLVVAVGIFLRVYKLGGQSLWLDEAISYTFSNTVAGGVTGIASFVAVHDIHPPLFYLLLHFCSYLGTAEATLRLLSTIAGILSIPLLYMILSRLMDHQVGILGAMLLAIAPFHVWYAQEVRMYALLGFFVLLAAYGLIEFRRTDRNQWLVLYVFSSTIAIYTHYSAFLFLIALNLFILCDRSRSNVLMRWLIAQAIVGVLYIPWLANLIKQVLSGGRRWFVFKPNLIDVGQVIKNFIFGETLPSVPPSILSIITLIMIGLLLGSFALVERDKRRSILLLTFWVLVPVIGSILISYKTMVFGDKYLIAASFPLYGFIAIALRLSFDRMKPIFFLLVIMIMLAVIGLSLHNYYFDPNYQREDWRGAVTYVEAMAEQGDIVAFRWIKPMAPFLYYSRDRLPVVGLVKDAESGEVNQSKVDYEVASLAEVYKRIWLFEYLGDHYDPQRFVHLSLQKNGYIPVEEHNFNRVVVVLWKASSIEK